MIIISRTLGCETCIFTKVRMVQGYNNTVETACSLQHGAPPQEILHPHLVPPSTGGHMRAPTLTHTTIQNPTQKHTRTRPFCRQLINQPWKVLESDPTPFPPLSLSRIHSGSTMARASGVVTAATTSKGKAQNAT
jgi:hypothetical protein